MPTTTDKNRKLEMLKSIDLIRQFSEVKVKCNNDHYTDITTTVCIFVASTVANVIRYFEWKIQGRNNSQIFVKCSVSAEA